jgi:hypothetical protein
LLASGVALATAGVLTAVAASAATTTRYEAENGTCQGTIDNNHAGFSGTGFCNLTNAVGSTETWAVNAPSAGTATLSIRYSNGTAANRPMNISVNGGAPVTVIFPSTSVWTTWATATIDNVALNAGTNTIKAASDTADGGPNLDDVDVAFTPGTPGTSQLIEAETGTISSGTVDNNHAGFTGTGFVNLTNAVGSYLELTFNVATAGTTTLTWRYANGNATNRPADISVNGGAATRLDMPTTGAWTTWANATMTADLVAGTNTVRLTSVTADGAANIDSLTVGASGPPVSTSPSAPASSSPPPGGLFGDPHLVSMFNGTDLTGWTSSASGLWTVQNGAIYGNGTARGWLYFNHQVGTFRWIFDVMQVSGDHAPTVLIWGTTNPIRDALSAIQFQPPNGGHWDYRPGKNTGGGSEFTQLSHPKFDIHQWSQCELIANMTTGSAKMACGQLGSAKTICNAVEVLDFHDPTAGVVGPLAIQVHNSGIHDEYKGLYLESPVVTAPDQFITTHC